MSPPSSFNSPNPLRVITQRLSSTAPQQLPHVVPSLANSLLNCRLAFSSSDGQTQNKDRSEAEVLVHKFKTQISAFLQDKNAATRWSAIVLIKATMEVGGWEILQSAGPWTRGLLGILGVR